MGRLIQKTVVGSAATTEERDVDGDRLLGVETCGAGPEGLCDFDKTMTRVLGSTVGCVDCKLKFPTRRTTKNMLREMDHSLLPLDAQCRAAEVELREHVPGVTSHSRSRLLLVGLPRSRSDPANRFAGSAQVHRL